MCGGSSRDKPSRRTVHRQTDVGNQRKTGEASEHEGERRDVAKKGRRGTPAYEKKEVERSPWPIHPCPEVREETEREVKEMQEMPWRR